MPGLQIWMIMRMTALSRVALEGNLVKRKRVWSDMLDRVYHKISVKSFSKVLVFLIRCIEVQVTQAKVSRVSPCLYFVIFSIFFLNSWLSSSFAVGMQSMYVTDGRVCIILNCPTILRLFTFCQRGVGIQLFDYLKLFIPRWWQECCFHGKNQSSDISSCLHACLPAYVQR